MNKKPCRAVNLKDYEDLVKATPGLRIARAKAIRRNCGVKVIVVPYLHPSKKQKVENLNERFKEAIYRYLSRHRNLTTKIQIADPQYIEVSVHATIETSPTSSFEVVRERVQKKLDDFFNPSRGYNGWPFGGTVYKSKIYSIITEVESVTCVRKLFLISGGKSTNELGNVKISEDALVYSGTHQVEAVKQ